MQEAEEDCFFMAFFAETDKERMKTSYGYHHRVCGSYYIQKRG